MKKNKQLGVVNGKDEAKSKPRSLDEIFGYNALSEYGTDNENEYLESLRRMNLADLYAHAPEKGVLPADSRERTVQRLLVAFRIHKSKYAVVPKVQENKMTKAKREKALQIMRG